MDDTPSLSEVKDGPLIARNISEMRHQDGRAVETKPMMALCRCGHSKNKPFCDGSHNEAGFQDRGGKPEGPDRIFTYEGAKVTVTFNPRLCVHAAECGRLAPEVFNTSQKPWIQPDQEVDNGIAAVMRACPSGALKEAPRGETPMHQFDETRVQVTVQKDGPFWVQDVPSPVPPEGQGMSARKYALCRCGMSGAKPYCDGSHRDKAWKDDM
ncbi:MAG: CDGSH iron-sulfur domain-containing protein [Pseudomonadota bacterium]